MSQRATVVKDSLISIIDDDEATLSAVAGLMRAKGFRVCAFSSAEAFLKDLSHEASQCIITDIQMPGLNGIELKRRLDAQDCKIPVIMITARVEQRLQSLAVSSGAFCLLRKPFKASALIECVQRALAG